ncbi:MAG: hypothetical protein MUO31_05450 [Thermodesulfovibrionales bacterium]|nr:hypothetical protein [Thermodesulfovibrionales bacterium]
MSADGRFYHLVRFKSPQSNTTRINPESYAPRTYNEQGGYLDANEYTKERVITTIASLSNATNSALLISVVSQLILYFKHLHESSILNQILEKTGNSKKFIENVASLDANGGIQFLFRYALKLSNNIKNEALAKQSMNLVDIVRYIFYRESSAKSSSGKKQQLGGCTNPKCRLKGRVQFFVSFDYTGLHSCFCFNVLATSSPTATKREIFFRLVDYYGDSDSAEAFRRLLG